MFVRPNQKIDFYQSSSSNLAYECSQELDNCMIECRKSAFYIPLLSNDIVASDANLPISELQPLKKSLIYANKFCDFIKNSTEHAFGFMIYLRYKNNNAISFPQVEDLHLGRICCNLSDISDMYQAKVDC